MWSHPRFAWHACPFNKNSCISCWATRLVSSEGGNGHAYLIQTKRFTVIRVLWSPDHMCNDFSQFILTFIHTRTQPKTNCKTQPIPTKSIETRKHIKINNKNELCGSTVHCYFHKNVGESILPASQSDGWSAHMLSKQTITKLSGIICDLQAPLTYHTQANECAVTPASLFLPITITVIARLQVQSHWLLWTQILKKVLSKKNLDVH